MSIGVAIRDVLGAEQALAGALRVIGERHRDDHDVFHLAGTLRGIADANLARLAPHAERHGVAAAPHATSVPEPGDDGLALVRDLRALHLLYAAASIDYVILGQGAQAARDADLLATVSECHAQTLRGMKWTVTRIKDAAPQALTG